MTVGVTVDDLVASDKFMTMPAINLDMRPGSSSGSLHSGPSTASGVVIRNLHVASFSTMRRCGPGGDKKTGCHCVPGVPDPNGVLPRGIRACGRARTAMQHVILGPLMLSAVRAWLISLFRCRSQLDSWRAGCDQQHHFTRF